MKLRKQLFAAFLSVAILPLVGTGLYMFGSNLMLSFDLYEQNLQNSTEIQVDLLEENIDRLMVRAGRFASSRAVKAACSADLFVQSDTNDELSKDILSFTDETLDNVALFALVDQNANLLYSSGSNGDTRMLTEILPEVRWGEEQEVREILFGEKDGSLLISTPVKENMQTVGYFFVVCRTDYFLRIMSSHKQLEATNALIYCKNHHRAVVSKQEVVDALPELNQKLGQSEQGSVLCRIGTEWVLVYYRTISKTQWVLANSISTSQIFSHIWTFGLINVLVILLVLLIVLFFSQRQSKKMLKPLEKLLDAVEHFFVSGAKDFQKPKLEHGTEIEYLAEKFSGMSEEVSSVHGRLRESTYLYHALLQATYEFRLTLDLTADTIHCTWEPLTKRLLQPESLCASERMLAFLSGDVTVDGTDATLLRDIVYGRIAEPAETVVCCNMGKHREETWYHLVAVPIMESGGLAESVVLHFEDITQKKHEEFRLIHSSQTDPLCGLLNKSAFPLHCRLSESGKTDAMFFIDLDHFKQINDTLGHAAGDEVLIATAAAIREHFRDGDAIGRYGGDEFVVFAQGMSQKLAEQKAAALVEALSFYREAPTAQLHVTASVGVCIVKRPMELTQAIQRADEAMYRAKENGKSQYVII